MPPSAPDASAPIQEGSWAGSPAAPPLGDDARRAVAALLRARAHRLPHLVAPRLATAARLLPVLLHASFEHPLLEEDAPGIPGLRYRRRWSSLARAFGLPPPCRAQRGRCLVEAVLAVPTPTGLDALVLVPAGLAPEELTLVQARLAGAQQVLAAGGAPLGASLLDPARLARDRVAPHRAIAFGALLAGRPGPALWAALEVARRPLPTLALSALAASAPAPLATLALTLLTRAPCPGPLEAVLALLARGVGLRQMADPESFCVRWASLVPGLGQLLDEALRLARPGEGDLARLVAHGRALAVGCASAIRGSGVGRLDRFTEGPWREALGPGMPRVLLPALGAGLAAEAAAGRLRLDPVRAGRSYEVRLAGGALLGRGASPVQARLRALGLVAAADAARPAARDRGALGQAFAGLDAAWREVAQRLARPREHATLLLMVVAGGGARPGPPMDLLNRGPERALEFDGALAVLLIPGRRPAGRMLSPEETIQAVVRRAPGGASLELHAAHVSARPVAARLAQIAGLLRDPSVPGPVAIEAGGRVLVPDGPRARSFPLSRFAARPRTFTPDPDAPDISISTGERQGLRARQPGVVHCKVVPVDAHTAALLYADGAGGHLRETVPYPELEVQLADARELVRAAQPPAVLAVRLSDGLEAAVRRAGPPGARVGVVVGGALPFVEVEFGGERFGGASALGWGAAAEALLARWPAGGEGVVSVNRVTATTRGARPPPLLALYASAVARRRLRTHLARAVAAYRIAAAGRREG